MTRGRDPLKAASLERWADELMDTQQVLPVDSRVFRLWARLMHGTSNTVSEDAVVHRLTVVTRNVRDFVAFLWLS